MAGMDLYDLSVGEIMTQWPETIGVFIAFNLHCIGCPIAVFHTLPDAAEEHGSDLGDLMLEIEGAIAGARAGLAQVRRR